MLLYKNEGRVTIPHFVQGTITLPSHPITYTTATMCILLQKIHLCQYGYLRKTVL